MTTNDAKQMTNNDFCFLWLTTEHFYFSLSLNPVMNEIQQHTIKRMNELGAQGKPFVFVIDFDFEKPLIFEWNDLE